jgi:hypothetical protein
MGVNGFGARKFTLRSELRQSLTKSLHRMHACVRLVDFLVQFELHTDPLQPGDLAKASHKVAIACTGEAREVTEDG